MTLLILEDNIDIRNTIEESVKIRDIFGDVHTAETIEEALKISEKNEVTVFVVDLKLPDGSGHDFIKQIRTMEKYKYSWVVIITGTSESVDDVLDAYNSSRCQRYIKKPFSMAYLCDTLEELCNLRLVGSISEERLMIRRKSVDYFFDYTEIVYIETVDKMAYLYTKDSKHAIGRITLSDLEDKLKDDRFVRVHRSFIINRSYIDQISRSNNQSLIKIKHYEHTIPIGRTYKDTYFY